MKKVFLLATGETANVNDEYGERLIEQGQAEIVTAPESTPQEPEEEPVRKRKKT